MDNQISLIEFASQVRGCVATLALDLSPGAKENIARRLHELLNHYEFDNRNARPNLRQRMKVALRTV